MNRKSRVGGFRVWMRERRGEEERRRGEEERKRGGGGENGMEDGESRNEKYNQHCTRNVGCDNKRDSNSNDDDEYDRE